MKTHVVREDYGRDVSHGVDLSIEREIGAVEIFFDRVEGLIVKLDSVEHGGEALALEKFSILR